MNRLRLIAGLLAGFVLLSSTTLATPSAAAAAPAAAQLIAPANGSTATDRNIELSVRGTDPDGDPLRVRFEGRQVGATVPVSGTGSPFTIVAIPDLQNYTYSNRQATIGQQSQWVVGTRSTLNTAMVVQLGDLVSEEENLTQWGRTSAGLKVLDDASVPNTVVAGNHDFNSTTGAHLEYDQFFPPSRYSQASWTPASSRYGGYLGQNLFGADPVNTKNMNNFALFSAGGRDFLVLNLEWEAPAYATDWAKKVLAAYPDRVAIMVTHSFVGINGARRTTAERSGGVPADQLWNDFVSQQCQIRLVLSGHFHDGDLGEANRSDLNRCGQPVQQILTDYQDRANGGDGWLRYYTFDTAANTMTARTYSPKLNRFETDADSQFTLPFDLGGTKPAPFQTIATRDIRSGEVATAGWNGLAAGTSYEWRAVTSDATGSTVSSTWTVRTPPASELVDDTFTRNVSNGWGATTAGQAWQSISAASAYAVDGNVGRIVAPIGQTRGVRLPTVSTVDASILTDLAVSPLASGSGTYVALHGRRIGTSSYRAKLRYLANGSVSLSLLRYVDGEMPLASVTISGLTVTAGRYLRLRFELEGVSPTTLRAKVWPRDLTEPAAWAVTATDNTSALQAEGALGIEVYPSSSATSPATVTFDRYTVTRPGPEPPANPVGILASDSFGRTVSNGWGSATAGGTWTASGTSSRYAVSAGTGNHVLTTPGTSAETQLGTVAARDIDLCTDLAWNRAASQGTLYGSVFVRRQTDGSDYRLKVVVASSGEMKLVLVRRVGTTETTLGTAPVGGLTHVADAPYRVALRAVTTSGRTTLTAKLWRVGTTEPTAWAVTASDSTAVLQGPGSIGVNSYLSSSATTGVTMRVDELLAVAAG